MKPFLLLVAQHILNQHSNPENILVVLPGKRSGIFLKKHFTELIKQPFFVPKITTIDQLCEEATDEFVADKITLLVHLFNSFNEAKNKEPENFDSFLQWGNILLNDFNEIDRQLINASDLYTNLRNLQHIEDWSFNLHELSNRQINFETFWHTAAKTYNLFNNKCRQEKINYSGALYRKFALHVEQYAHNLQYEKIYFCGFNALSKAEEQIITTLCYAGKAEILWDADEYYVSSPLHEAGYFYRKFKNNHPDLSTHFIGNYFLSTQKNICVYACNGNIEQISALKAVMGNINGSGLNEAVVLCDESLLIPLLSDLPDRTKLNITMGYSIKYHHLFGFYNSISEIITAPQNIEMTLLQKLINNPFFIKYFKYKELQNYFKTNNITELNKTHINAIQHYFEPIAFIFNRVESIDDYSACITRVSDILKSLITASDSIIREIVLLIQSVNYKTYNIDIIRENQIGVNTYKQLLFRLLQSEVLSFIGEPLEGAQVMGMLETRALDFENIYLLSVNEDVIPKADNDNSFIPNELKKLYGLPTRKEQDCIYANHFYRLLQRAKNIHLFYNAMPGTMGNNEPSRYLPELENMLTPYNHQISFTKHQIQFKQSEQLVNETYIQKNEFYYQLLNNKLNKGISPTAINTFIRCKLDFYYKVLLGIREHKDLDEQTGHDYIGNLFHAVLEKYYTPFLNRPFAFSDIVKLKNNVDNYINEIAQEKDLYNYQNNAKYRLYSNVCVDYLMRYCNFEQNYLANNTLEILHLEKEISCNLAYNDTHVKLIGKIDRIDRLNNIYRVIDYKTGKVDDKNLKISINENIIDGKYDKALQLLIYAYLVFIKYPQYDSLTCGVYAIKQHHMFKPLLVDGECIIKRSQLHQIENILKIILDDMFSAGIIKHNEKSSYCILCE